MWKKITYLFFFGYYTFNRLFYVCHAAHLSEPSIEPLLKIAALQTDHTKSSFSMENVFIYLFYYSSRNLAWIFFEDNATIFKQIAQIGLQYHISIVQTD